jgi:histidyl-tRNA synthetase
MSKHASLPGFRDFYPEEMVRRNQIFTAWRDVARRYGFEEYDGPPLEATELYIEKSGPEIVNQLFNFTDKGGREVALRPEMTPTLVRMLGARIKGLPRPVRWFSLPQLFRYEKQQRGRLREHFQLNMDIVGDESVYADADLLAAALDVMRSLGLTAEDVVARISDRRLLTSVLLHSGVSQENLPTAYNVVDKIERDSREELSKRLQALGLDAEKAAEILAMTDLDLPQIREKYGSNEAVAKVLDDLDRYVAALEALGFKEWVRFDMKIVRGLAYYTGIVFELFDRKGELRAICGGGRYDNLFGSLAGVDVPSLGFGMGDVVLGELLKERKAVATHVRSVDYFIVAVNESVVNEALSIAGKLRVKGHSVIFPYKTGGVGKGLKAASAAGAREAIVVGPDELREGKIVVRNLAGGTEDKVDVETFIGELR